MFFPEKLPADYKFSFQGKFEEINFNTEENIFIHSLLFHSESPKGLILYFHGNAGSLASWSDVAHDFLPLGYDILIPDFRGFGKSTGSISSEKQLHHDAEFIFNEMLKKYPEEKIVIYGRSIGSGIAAKLAASHFPKALILETPFFNFTDVVGHYYPLLPSSFILKYKFENNLWIKQVQCPVFIIHGTNDEIVPYRSGKQLAELPGKITFFTIEGGMHNNLRAFKEFHEILNTALQ